MKGAFFLFSLSLCLCNISAFYGDNGNFQSIMADSSELPGLEEVFSPKNSRDAANAAQAVAKENGFAASVVITDVNGHILYSSCMYNSDPQDLGVAHAKAQNALLSESAIRAPLVFENFALMYTDNLYLALSSAALSTEPGAALIRVNGKTVGAVGISGSANELMLKGPNTPLSPTHSDTMGKMAEATSEFFKNKYAMGKNQ